MALLESRADGPALLADRYVRIDDEEAIPTDGGVLVSLARFERDCDTLLSRGEPLGVWLASNETPAALASHLDRLALVALDFPVFSDGRAYSSARLLRERYGYKGEIRAIGDVLCEQLPFMLRSGFDSFDMKSPRALEEFRAVVGEVRVVYQPTGDGRPTAIDRRLGRR
jgi:uncharacterized protein (DUF934 family)